MYTSKIKDFIYKVLEIEAPIHIDDCFERITKYLGLKSPIDYYYSYTMFLNQEINSGKIIEKNNFLYLKNTRILIRNRKTPEYEVYCGKINIAYIPPDEIIKIAKKIIKNSYSIDDEELVKLVSQEIGFKRMTQKISDVIYSVFEQLKNDDEIRYKLGRYNYVPAIQTDEIIKIAKKIIVHYKNIQEEDLEKQIMQEIGSKTAKNTKNVIFEGLKLLRNDAEIKYEFGSYSIQQNSSQYEQKENNQENTKQFNSFLNKACNFIIKSLFNS